MVEKAQILTEYLVLKIQGGNKSSLAQLFRLWNSSFLRDASIYLKDQELAKDIVQDSWITIIGQIPTLKDPSRFVAWSKRIIYFKSMDHHRKIKRTSHESDYSKETTYEPDERIGKINAILKGLDEEEQLLINWYYKEGLMISQITEILNIPEGTVKSRLHTLRTKIKEKLKSQYYEN